MSFRFGATFRLPRASARRIDAIMARLASSPTYWSELEEHDPRAHAPVAGTIERVFDLLDEGFSGSAEWLSAHRLTDEELDSFAAEMAPANGSAPGS